MGQCFEKTCGDCGEHDMYYEVGTMREELFRCDTCGELKWVERRETFTPILN